MIKERSRYHFVYQAILAQIEQGQLSPGDSLPTAQQLCRQYGVGITTIRRVLRMLEASQVISCVQGRPALVIGLPGGDEPQDSIELLAERGEALLDLCDCICYLYPGLVMEGAARWRAGGGSVLELTRKAEHDAALSSTAYWTRSVIDKLLGTLKNPILDSLRLKFHLWVGFLTMVFHDHPCSEMEIGDLRAAFYQIAASLDAPDAEDAPLRIMRFYRMSYRTLKRHLEGMTCGRIPMRSIEFTWSGNGGRLHLYMDLALKLIEQMANGQLRDGELLPSLAQMAQQHQVSEITARKALAYLNELGVARTINGKGTQVTFAACRQLAPPYDHPALREGVINHLYTLQILALTCPDIFAQAVAAAPASARAEAGRLAQDNAFMENDANPVTWWHTFILRYTASPGLRTIYKQLLHMLQWGQFLLFYRYIPEQALRTRQLYQRVMSCIASGDVQGVGPAAAAYYCYVMESVRESLPHDLAADCPYLICPDKI